MRVFFFPFDYRVVCTYGDSNLPREEFCTLHPFSISNKFVEGFCSLVANVECIIELCIVQGLV